MMTTEFVSRRAFLAGTAAASVMTTLPATAGETVVKGKTVRKAESRPAKMKLSLAAYSFNRVLPKSYTEEQRAAADMTLEDFVDYCAELQLDACELTGYYFPKSVTAEYLNSLKQRTFRLGLDISGTAIGNDFCVAPGPKRDAQLKMTRDWIDYATTMGAPVIRIFAGRVPKGETEAVALERCIEGIQQSLEYAAGKGVFLALENHGGITATPAQMMRIINAVKDSPWFGVNFDGGNFRTDDPYRDLAEIAPYAINAQIKVMMANDKGEKFPADLKKVIGILKSVGYRGYIVLEYEEREDPKTHIPKYIDSLREAIG